MNWRRVRSEEFVTRRLFPYNQTKDVGSFGMKNLPARFGEVEAFHNTCAWNSMTGNHLFARYGHLQQQQSNEGATDCLRSRVEDEDRPRRGSDKYISTSGIELGHCHG